MLSSREMAREGAMKRHLAAILAADVAGYSRIMADDVTAEGDDVFGDGVNVAARLQSLADAGGVRISRQAYDQVEGKLGVTYRSLGEQTLKNIPRPIGVYAAEFGGDGTGVAAPALKQEIIYCRAPDGT